MEAKNYQVEWNARGMDFNYNGVESVWAPDKDSAKEKVFRVVSQKMVMSRHLIEIKSVKIA